MTLVSWLDRTHHSKRHHLRDDDIVCVKVISECNHFHAVSVGAWGKKEGGVADGGQMFALNNGCPTRFAKALRL